MSAPFLAEIRIFAGNFAIRGWASCDGQLMPINQNPALFSLLGTTFGGDGRSTYGLPNFQGSVPVCAGSGPGLSQRFPGQKGGSQTVTLTAAQIASHNHSMNARPLVANNSTPSSTVSLAKPDPATNHPYQAPSAASLVNLGGSSVGPTGGNGAHNNMQPYLTLFFIIALQGDFPQRQ